MRKFSMHLSFIAPIFIVVAAFAFLRITQLQLAAYEQALNKDYSVILIARKSIELPAIPHAKSIKEISPQDIIERLKKQLSAQNIEALRKVLPKFYSLGFDEFMSERQIAAAKERLLRLPNIERVEVFSKTHTKVFHLLQLLRWVLAGSAVLIAALCWAIFSKQVRIWRFEHAERIYILELFGASFFGRCGFLVRLIIVDLLIVYLLTLGLFAHFLDLSQVASFYERLDIPRADFDAAKELAIICAAVLAASLAALAQVQKGR